MSTLLKQWARLTRKDPYHEHEEQLDQLESLSTFIIAGILEFYGTNWARLGSTSFWGLHCTTAGACANLELPLIFSWPHGYKLARVNIFIKITGTLTAGITFQLNDQAGDHSYNDLVGATSGVSSTAAGTYMLTCETNRPFENNSWKNFFTLTGSGLDQTAGAQRLEIIGFELLFEKV